MVAKSIQGQKAHGSHRQNLEGDMETCWAQGETHHALSSLGKTRSHISSNSGQLGKHEQNKKRKWSRKPVRTPCGLPRDLRGFSPTAMATQQTHHPSFLGGEVWKPEQLPEKDGFKVQGDWHIANWLIESSHSLPCYPRAVESWRKFNQL